MTKAYIAGPFFNPTQMDHYKSTVSTVEKAGVDTFSVVRDGVVCKPNASLTVQEESFKKNVDEIRESQFLVAILDYLDAPLFAVKSDRDLMKVFVPDNGTVFEMGFAYSEGKPIIGFATNAKMLNLMLARSTYVVVNTLEDLEKECRALSAILEENDIEKLVAYVAGKKAESWRGEIV